MDCKASLTEPQKKVCFPYYLIGLSVSVTQGIGLEKLYTCIKVIDASEVQHPQLVPVQFGFGLPMSPS